MRLRAGHEAFAKHATRANRNHALNDVKAFAQRVPRGVQQRADALLLVVMKHRPAHAVSTQLGLKPDQQKHAQQPQHHGRHDQLPAQTRKEDNRQPSGQHQQRCAQVRLLHDQTHGHNQQQPGHQKIKRSQLALTLLKPPGQHQRHGNF